MLGYEKSKSGQIGIIHGDPVFSNVLIDKLNNIKLIDPRGTIGVTSTIFGDIFYDYAKIYQSLLGYDEVMQNKFISDAYRTKMIKVFKSHIVCNYNKKVMDNIIIITNSLLFTLIPLHNNERCKGYYSLIK